MAAVAVLEGFFSDVRRVRADLVAATAVLLPMAVDALQPEQFDVFLVMERVAPSLQNGPGSV